jgi:hypothetical protein
MGGSDVLAFEAQTFYPGVELLCRKFLLKAVQTGGPEFTHYNGMDCGRAGEGTGLKTSWLQPACIGKPFILTGSSKVIHSQVKLFFLTKPRQTAVIRRFSKFRGYRHETHLPAFGCAP